MESKWQITVRSGLQLHFKQANGPSRAGTDWAVALRKGEEEYPVFVRSYADDVAGLGQEQEAKLVVQYVAGLLQQGWTPDHYSHEPGELTLPSPRKDRRETASKRWWRFW